MTRLNLPWIASRLRSRFNFRTRVIHISEVRTRSALQNATGSQKDQQTVFLRNRSERRTPFTVLRYLMWRNYPVKMKVFSPLFSIFSSLVYLSIFVCATYHFINSLSSELRVGKVSFIISLTQQNGYNDFKRKFACASQKIGCVTRACITIYYYYILHKNYSCYL